MPVIGSASRTVCRFLVAALWGASLATGLWAAPAHAEDATKLLKAPVVPVPPLFDQADIDRATAALDGIVENAMKRTGVPGIAVGIVYKDKVIYAKGFGVREVGKPGTIDPDTLFLLASVSKPIASTIVAKLVGDGVVKWDDPAKMHNPAFALNDPYVTEHATIADLMSHRSGLRTGSGDLLEDLGFDRTYILSHLDQQPLDPFRVTYHYSNFGYTAGGIAAAVAAGKSWEDLADEALFKPAGMTTASYRHADYLADKDRALHPCAPTRRQLGGEIRPRPGRGGPGRRRQRLAQRHAALRAPPARQRHAGRQGDRQGGRTRARPRAASDPRPAAFARRARRLLRLRLERLLRRRGPRPHRPFGRLRSRHRDQRHLHAGRGSRHRRLDQRPADRRRRGDRRGLPRRRAERQADRRLGRLHGRHLRADGGGRGARGGLREGAGQIPKPARNLAAYVGSYGNSYYGPLVVSAEGDNLSMSMGPQGAPTTFALTHFDGDTFSFETIGENANGLAGAIFTVGEDGEATKVVLDYYDRTGLGTFVRE